MKLKIIKDCLMARLPHQPNASFKAGAELEVEESMAERLLEKGFAEKLSGTEKKEVEPTCEAIETTDPKEIDESSDNEKSLTPDLKNKSLLHNKKLKNKSGE